MTNDGFGQLGDGVSGRTGDPDDTHPERGPFLPGVAVKGMTLPIAHDLLEAERTRLERDHYVSAPLSNETCDSCRRLAQVMTELREIGGMFG